MNTNISKALYSLVIIILGFGVSACGMSKEAKAVTEMISQIQYINLDYADEIFAAEDAFNALEEKQKDQVENHDALVKAKAELGDFVGRKIYSDLNSVVDETNIIVEKIDISWRYGIQNMDNATVKGLASITKVDFDELEKAIEYLGFTGNNQTYFLKSKWYHSVNSIIAVYTVNGKFDTVESDLVSSKSNIKMFEDHYPEYKQLSKLKEYYIKAEAYFNMALEPTVTYDEFVENAIDYQSTFTEYRQELKFEFGY